MIRVRSMLLAVLLVLAPAGAAVAPAGAQGRVPAIAPVPAPIAALVADRAAAFVKHDEAMLAGTLRPGRFADRQLAALRNAADLEFTSFEARVSTQFSADVASSRIRARYPGLQVAAYHVIEEHGVGGYDEVPYSEDLFFTFVRSGPDGGDRYDGWRIASDADFEALGIFSAVRMWDVGRVATIRSEHFLLMTHPENVEQMRPVLQNAEQGYAAVREFWPRPVDDRFVIIAPSTTDELRDLIQATVDLSKFVAFAAGTITRETGFEPRGVRIYLQLSRFERYDEAGRTEILAHELVHAITRPISGPFIPTWVEEGIAMYGAEGESGLSSAKAGSPPTRFPTDDLFFVGPTRQIVTRYSQAQIAIATLAKRSGKEGLVAFYAELGRARVAAGTDTHHVDRAVRASVGWSVPEWTKAWSDRLR